MEGWKSVYARDNKNGKYVVIDEREKSIPAYDSRFCTIFTWMWSNDESLGHAKAYKSWGGYQTVRL